MADSQVKAMLGKGEEGGKSSQVKNGERGPVKKSFALKNKLSSTRGAEQGDQGKRRQRNGPWPAMWKIMGEGKNRLFGGAKVISRKKSEVGKNIVYLHNPTITRYQKKNREVPEGEERLANTDEKKNGSSGIGETQREKRTRSRTA